jgi:hypothetical protein
MPITTEPVADREPWRIPMWLGPCAVLAIAGLFRGRNTALIEQWSVEGDGGRTSSNDQKERTNGDVRVHRRS